MIGNASKLFNYPDRLAAYVAEHPVVPVTIELHPTNRCNQSCRYCVHRHDDAELDYDDIASILAQAHICGVEGIVVSGGGEPTLGNMEAFVNSPVPCGLITNGGVPVSADVYKAFRWVRFSVDSPDDETYLAVRGVPMPSCLKDNIRASAKQTTTGVQMVITKYNRWDCDELGKWAKALGAHYLHIRPDEHGSSVWISPNAQQDAWDVEDEDFKVLIREEKFEDRPKAPKCHAGHFMMTIDPHLDCWICSCGENRFHMGSLKGQSLQDVIYGVKRARVLAEMSTQSCPAMCKGANINVALESCAVHSEFL